jgi:GLPGLI family protein
MNSGARATVAVILTLLLAAAAFGQGMTWDSKLVSNGREMVTHTYYVPKKLKTVMDSDGNFSIIRVDQEKIYNVNTKEKTYSVMTFADLEKMGKKMNEESEKLQKQMKDMPEEQRKMMEKMLGSSMPGAKKDPKVEVVKTDEQKSISGFTCSRYVVKQDGKEMITLWVTTDVKVVPGMKTDLMEQTKRMAAMTPGGLKGLVDAMQKIEGFPIETEMGTLMKTTVTRVDMKTVAASEFEVPAGFTKVQNSELEGKEKEK